MDPFINGTLKGSIEPTVMAELNPAGLSPDVSS